MPSWTPPSAQLFCVELSMSRLDLARGEEEGGRQTVNLPSCAVAIVVERSTAVVASSAQRQFRIRPRNWSNRYTG